MYILSVTMVVEPAKEQIWRAFLTDELLPLTDSSKITLCRVLSNHHEGHFTFSLQIPLESMSEYMSLNSAIDNLFASKNFGEEILHFSTLLKKETLC